MLKKLRAATKSKTGRGGDAYYEGSVSERDVHDFLDAAKYGRWRDVEAWLLADRRRFRHVNDTPGGRWSALHQASYWGSDEGTDILLRHGADPTARNRNGETPAVIARSRGHARLADRLERATGEWERKVSAEAEAGRKEAVGGKDAAEEDAVVKADAEAAPRKASGRQVTLFRALNLHPSDERDKFRDEDALDAFCADPKSAGVRYPFVDYDRPVFPLLPAVRIGASANVVKRILDAHPAALHERTGNGSTLLHEACSWNAPDDTVRLLASKMPDAPRVQNALGLLPLHLACRFGASSDVVRTVVDAYPGSVRVRDADGKTPLALAGDDSEAADVLRRFGGAGGFYAKLMEDDDRNVVFKISELAPLIEDVHHARLFYTLVSSAYRSGGITRDDRAAYALDGLRTASATTTCTDSVALFKLLLRKANGDGALSDLEREKLDREAEVTHTSHAPFVRDLREQIRSCADRVDGLEASVDAFDRSVERLRSGIRYQKRVEAAVGLMGAVLNAVSLGVAGSVLSSATSAVIGTIVDFGDVVHVAGVVEAVGDATVKDAFEMGLSCAESCADSRLEKFAGCSPIVAIAFAASVMDRSESSVDDSEEPRAPVSLMPKEGPRLIDRVEFLEDQLSLGDVPASISGRISNLEMKILGSMQAEQGSLLERLAHLERELGVDDTALVKLHPV